jgi:hypothetical protein
MTMVTEGIPEEILKELNIDETEEAKSEFVVTAIVEKHQVKLPIPSEARRELTFLKGQKLKLKVDLKKRTLTYEF